MLQKGGSAGPVVRFALSRSPESFRPARLRYRWRAYGASPKGNVSSYNGPFSLRLGIEKSSSLSQNNDGFPYPSIPFPTPRRGAIIENSICSRMEQRLLRG